MILDVQSGVGPRFEGSFFFIGIIPISVKSQKRNVSPVKCGAGGREPCRETRKKGIVARLLFGRREK